MAAFTLAETSMASPLRQCAMILLRVKKLNTKTLEVEQNRFASRHDNAALQTHLFLRTMRILDQSRLAGRASCKHGRNGHDSA